MTRRNLAQKSFYTKYQWHLYSHYANTPMQYTAIFHGCKNVNFQMKTYNIFLFLLKNIDCGYTHNLCFRAKIRKNVYPCTPQFYYIKVGYKGILVTRTCFRDGRLFLQEFCLESV